MGVDYYVALHSADWPTTQAVQQCIDHHGWPIKVGRTDHPRWTMPFDGEPKTLGLPVVFKGEAIDLEASFVTLSPTQPFAWSLDVDRPPDVELGGGKTWVFKPQSEWKFKPVDINERLAELGSDERFSYGDRVLTLTFRMNRKEWQAGFYLMAALIKCFDGYGFNYYDPENRTGKSIYADSLIREADKLGSDR